MSIKSKVNAIKKDVQNIVAEVTDESYDVFTYGSYLLGLAGLCILVSVETDKEKARLQADEKLIARILSSLVLHDYPADEQPNVVVWIESQETVDRDSKGDWHLHIQ